MLLLLLTHIKKSNTYIVIAYYVFSHFDCIDVVIILYSIMTLIYSTATEEIYDDSFSELCDYVDDQGRKTRKPV
eukprot:UN01518